MTTADVLAAEPRQRSAGSRPTIYRIPLDASPRRIRRGPDGAIYGEVRLVPDDDVPSSEESGVRPGYIQLHDWEDWHEASLETMNRSQMMRDIEGYDMRPDPLEATTVHLFLEAMRDFRLWAGQPSYRQMQRRCGGVCAASTFCNAMNPKRLELPKLSLVYAFVTACGGDKDECQRWATAWRRISMRHNLEYAL
ncbi:hypothetical protein [Salinactinospora qingdaonensis]|uniref:Uncharacterized protein n=1 Tax=Salinactinospora qingdaonensis TaxID=702744 RepID=A0ABP7EY23_9ACTN